MAAAGATFISGVTTELSPVEAVDLNIGVSVLDLEREQEHPYPLFLFNVDLSEMNACSIRGVWLRIINNQDQLVFGSSIAEDLGGYTFQIIGDYLAGATLGITCDEGPDRLDSSYTIKLQNYARAL